MTRENARIKAERYLAEGRLIVTGASTRHVTSSCRGDGAIWRQGYVHGIWHCDCPCRTDQCSHLLALRLVTAPDLPDHDLPENNP